MNKVYLKSNKIEVECSGIIDVNGNEKCIIKSDEEYNISGEALSRIMLLLNNLPGVVCIKSFANKEFQIAETEEIKQLIKDYYEVIKNYRTLCDNYQSLKTKVEQHNKSCRFYERKIRVLDCF